MVTPGAHEAVYNESSASITQGDSATDTALCAENTAMCADVPRGSVDVLAAQAVLRKPPGKPEIGPCFRY